LHPVIEEFLYSAMEDFRLDIMIESGPNARSIQISLPKFTLIALLHVQAFLTAPLRSRFGIINRLIIIMLMIYLRLLSVLHQF